MDSKELNKIRKELISFSKQKGMKKSVIPYQKKAVAISQLNDEDLEKWYNDNGKMSYTSIVFNELTRKADKAKYNSLKRKSESWDFEGFTDDQIDFIELYEEENNIEDTILC